MIGKNNRRSLYLIVILSLVLSLSTLVMAESTPVSIEMSSTNLTLGNSVSVVIKVDGAIEVDNVSVQSLDKFDVLSSSQTSSTNIINGERSDLVEIHLELMPKETGHYPIVAFIESGKERYESNEIDVEISGKKPASEGEVEDIFLKTVITANESYFGEKLLLTYELYTNKNISGYDFIEALELDGFIVQEFSRDKLNQSYVDITGVQYIKIEAKKIMLNPTSTGDFVIPSRRFQVNVGSGGFYETSQPLFLDSEEIELNILPVPELGKPEDFSGLVGNVVIEGHYDKTEVVYGDPVTLSVRLSGTGNLDIIENLIKDGSIKDFTVYETSQGMSESIVNGDYATEKNYEVILVPQELGTLTIEPIKISYFNTASSSYEYVELPGRTIQVGGEKTAETTNAYTNNLKPVLISQVTIEDKNEDYFLIKLDKKLVKVISMGLSMVALLIVILLYINKNRDRRTKGDNLKTIKSKIRKSNDASRLYDIYSNYFKEQVGVGLKSSSTETIRGLLDSKEMSAHLVEVVDYLEHRQYADPEGFDGIKDRMIMIAESL